MASEITKITPPLLPWITTIVGWVIALLQWQKKRKAEAELKLIRRRGDAPYLVPSQQTFSILYFGATAGEIRIIQAGDGALLCFCREEVDQKTPKGCEVFFVISNTGESARRISIKLDGQPITLDHEPQMDDAHGLTWLQYPYDPAHHGRNQTLSIEFESSTGVQDRHLYSMKHGIRQLHRTDPS